MKKFHRNSIVKKGVKLSEKHKKNIRLGAIKKFKDHPELRKKISEALKKYYKEHPEKAQKRNKNLNSGKKGKESFAWKGGISINTNGHRLIYSGIENEKGKPKYIEEERLVAKKILGDIFDEKCRIYHLNRNNSDNRPENLYYFKNQSEALKAMYNGTITNLKSNLIDNKFSFKKLFKK